MPQLTHILRFKVLAVECGVLQTGQQYTIYYRRGDTRRSTPCYTARNGLVDFSPMPEGASVIHFKSGTVGRRFAPKYILFRLEEYIVGVPRRTVCETNVDCGNVLGPYDNAGSGVIEAPIQIYGVSAKMKVAILVYPENGLPLSFDLILKPQPPGPVEGSVGKVSVMSRGEAMTLLISLETMLERKKQANAEALPPTAARSALKLRELEEKRNELTGVEGMASKAITARCQDVVKAQFVALARQFRANYVGATAAYLRQMALMSGVLRGDPTAMKSEHALREQTARTTSRIDDLRQQIHQLELDQLSLGRIQHKTDVTAELMANLEKVDSLTGQIRILEQTQETNEKALSSRDSSTTPLGREVKRINDHIDALASEQEQLRGQVRHMVSSAAAHVLSWARSKNPPQAEVRNDAAIDNLFRDTGEAKLSTEPPRKGMAGSNPKSMALPQRAQSRSSSEHRTPNDAFNPKDLPSMGDFRENETQHRKEKPGDAKPQYPDPLKPTGLNTDMFAQSSSEPSIANSSAFHLMGSTHTPLEPGFSINVIPDSIQTMFYDTPRGNVESHLDPYNAALHDSPLPQSLEEAGDPTAPRGFPNFGYEAYAREGMHSEEAAHPSLSKPPALNFETFYEAGPPAVEGNPTTIFYEPQSFSQGKPTYDFAPSVDTTTQENDSKAQDKKDNVPIYNFAS
ncbi:unnamed protein product [Phytomonas sp. Hart1]|nr:unnamed protein product [Phytomonas sp. Hart1]|eukprot:CCW71412.1 unnamed protein product [Phytomonas sp. isolate Hart1]